MASRSPLVQALLSLPGSLNTAGSRQSFVQTTSNLPSQIQWGESPKPHSVSQGFTGATVTQPMNVVNPQQPDTFKAPTLATSDTVNALMPSTPAAPVPSAPAALVSAVAAEQPAAAAPTGVGAPGGATLEPNPPVPTVAPVTQPSYPTSVGPDGQPIGPVGTAIRAAEAPGGSPGFSDLLAQYAQLGKRLNPSVGSSRTSYSV